MNSPTHGIAPLPHRSSPLMDYLAVVVSDRHRRLFNAAAYRQRRLVDALGAKAGGRVRIVSKRYIENGDTDDTESEALHGRTDVPEEDLRYGDSVNAAMRRGVDNIRHRGNHDEPLRALEGQTRLGIHYAEKTRLITGSGKVVDILHGDQFEPHLPHLTDMAQSLGRWVARRIGHAARAAGLDPSGLPKCEKGSVGHRARDAAVALAHGLGHRVVSVVKKAHSAATAASTYFSMALYAATGVDFNPLGAFEAGWSRMNGFRQKFEDRAVNYALDSGADVVVTGHTHDAYMKLIKKGSLIGSFRKPGGAGPRIAERDILFINEGDGVTGHQALFIAAREDTARRDRLAKAGGDLVARGHCGEFDLMSWKEIDRVIGPAPTGVAEENRQRERDSTLRQIADRHEACLGVPAGTPVPHTRLRLRPDIRFSDPLTASASRSATPST